MESAIDIGFADILQYWIGAFLTLCIFSFLYKDNVLYKFGEALFVGTSVGYLLGLYYDQIAYPRLVVPLFYQGKLVYLIACTLGLMYLTRFSRRYGWLSRWPMAALIGFGSGYAIPYMVQAQLFKQLGASMLPLWSSAGFEFNNFLIVAGVLCTLFYFFFSIEHRGKLVKIPIRVGIIYIMVSFGATFGYTVMARFSLLIGRVNFLWYKWIKETVNFIT
ncbi:MAG: hypothetical protein U5N86_13205 [Planctomycetota bacterium]|nr:hypothetical protein [Planctomycetota bacterium]